MDSTEFKPGEWMLKIELEIVENEDKTCDLRFSWDDTDPELQPWTDLSDERRSEIMLEALTRGLNQVPASDP